MNDDIFRKEIIKRLDALIKISTLGSMKENTQTEKISLLSSVGFGPKEIADILNTSSNTVSVILNKLKKKKEGKDDKQGIDGGVAEQKENISTENISDNQ